VKRKAVPKLTKKKGKKEVERRSEENCGNRVRKLL
jgi:hypothetical protein